MSSFNLRGLARGISRGMHHHSPEIFTGFAICGVVATGLFAVEGTMKAKRYIDEWKVNPKKKRENAWKVVELYLPAIAAATFTIVSIVAANRILTARKAFLASLCTTSQATLMDFREKVRDVIGDEEVEKIDDVIVEETVQNAVSKNRPIHTGHGDDLIVEGITGQPMYDDISRVKDLWVDFKQEIQDFKEERTLGDWLYSLGVNWKDCKFADRIYWDPGDGLPSIYVKSTMIDGKVAYLLDYDNIRWCA